MGIYVRVFKDRSKGISLPRFEVMKSLPSEGKFVKLEPEECVDVANATISDDNTFVLFEEFRVSNTNDQAVINKTDEYTLPRYGNEKRND